MGRRTARPPARLRRAPVHTAGELEFTGDNAFLGYWRKGALQPRTTDYVATGDIVTEEDGRYFFQGRKSFSFKLANGRGLYPESYEDELRRLTGTDRLLARPTTDGGFELITDSEPAANRLRELQSRRELPLGEYVG